MQRLRSILTLVLLVALMITGSLTFAQVGVPDSDGDGVPDVRDSCPNEPGPVSNDGCPENAGPSTGPGDNDNDGVNDDIDFCPREAGPLSNGGCPLPEEVEAPPSDDSVLPTQPLPILPGSGSHCTAATQDTTPVNLRDFPNLTANVVGALDPYQIYPVLMQFSTPEGTWLRTYGGWFAAWVTRQGGDCADLPQFDTSTVPTGLLPNIQQHPYQNVADLPLKMLNCEGGLVGVLFGDEIGEPMMDENGDCVVPLTGQTQLVIPTNDTTGNMAGDGWPADAWSWGASTESNYLTLSCPTLVHIIEPADGVPVVSLLTAARCLGADAQELWPAEGTPLGDLIPEAVWVNLFDVQRPDLAPLPPDVPGGRIITPEQMEAEVNFGWQFCTDLFCATDVVTDLGIPSILAKHLSDCVTVTIKQQLFIDQPDSAIVPWTITYTMPGDPCPGGHWKGATIGLYAFNSKYPDMQVRWRKSCSNWTSTKFSHKNTDNKNPMTYTLNEPWEGKIHCEITLFPNPNPLPS